VRICMYTETALPKMGGQEMVVDALARQYLLLGHDVVVLAPYPRRPLRARDETLPYRVVRHPRFVSTRHFVTWYRWFLTRLHKSHRTEILHCHNIYIPGYLAALTRQQRGIPTVITSHGGDVQAENVRLVKPLLRKRIIESLRAADALVAISRFTQLRMRNLCPEANIVSIPNGVDLAPYSRSAGRPDILAESLKPKGYLLFMGRLKERKGVDVLLRALALMSAAPPVPLVVAGAGEEQTALEELSQSLGLRERVWFVGAAHHPAKAYLFQNALATVVPSRIWEAFGLVALESFASGTPVIGTRLPGLEDLIEPGKTGWLVPPESPQELAKTLHTAWSNRENCHRMGDEARRFANDFDWTVVARRHLELYQELIEKNANQAA
jgi:glycosyltransferase involved in cell wall biosynthesis